MTKNSFVAEVTFKSMLLTIPDSFLISRFCRNLVNGYTSEWLESDFELPQGSILSPVLFLVFTGDLSADPAKSNLKLPNCPSKYPPNESKYADDYNLWWSCINIKQLQEELQWDLNIIMDAVVSKMEDKQTKNTGHSIWKQKQKKLQNWNHSKWFSNKTSQRKDNPGHDSKWKTHIQITYWI